MTSALRWAAMRAVLMFRWLWGTKSPDRVHKPQLLKRQESRSGIEPRSFRLPAYRLTARPNRLSLCLLWTIDNLYWITMGKNYFLSEPVNELSWRLIFCAMLGLSPTGSAVTRDHSGHLRVVGKVTGMNLSFQVSINNNKFNILDS